jgi:hypothetical protein
LMGRVKGQGLLPERGAPRRPHLPGRRGFWLDRQVIKQFGWEGR